MKKLSSVSRSLGERVRRRDASDEAEKTAPKKPTEPARARPSTATERGNDYSIGDIDFDRHRSESREADDSDGLITVGGGPGALIDILFGGDDDSQRAEDKDEDATVAIFDSFDSTVSSSDSSHGELVESIFLDAGFEDEDIQRFQIGGGGSLSGLAEGLADGDEEALQNYVEDRITGLLDSTSDGLEEILDDDDSQIRTINQSQSQAEARVTRDIWEEAKEDDEFRADLAGSLGLPEDASDEELAQALVDEVDGVVESSDRIAESRERYDELSEEAADRGITHVVTSGNLGSFGRELEDLGVEVDDDFYTSVLANDHVTVVAAVDDMMTDSTRDDASESFNSPFAEAEIAAAGDVLDPEHDDGPTVRDGTSYAAPKVAAAAALIAAENPDLTHQEIEELLLETSDRIKAPEGEIGMGVLDLEEALEEAA